MTQVKRVRNRRRGFTLLEILVVVGILALLAAFVVPSLIGTQKDAYIKTTKANMDSLASVMQLFNLHMGRFPKELAELRDKPEDEAEEEKWKGPYIDSLDKLKDAWGHEFQYLGNDEAKANEGSYDIWSLGPDGEDNTDDDIRNWADDDG
ncbi:MAG: type II secretion system major pseudopilin GspG [Phycisphaerae bacterium]|jgi:general secretion pathway protein G|nr:type II secretion system major pseudopilin GspG [Phycisphaerae bacterium]